MPSPSLVAREEEPQGSSSADIESWLPAFAGLEVEPLRKMWPADMAEQLKSRLVYLQEPAITVPAAWFEAIATRIREMESMLIGSTWVEPPADPEPEGPVDDPADNNLRTG